MRRGEAETNRTIKVPERWKTLILCCIQVTHLTNAHIGYGIFLQYRQDKVLKFDFKNTFSVWEITRQQLNNI